LTFRKYLSHALAILSGMFIVFFALDIRNPAMAWIDNRITKALLIIYAVSTMTLAVSVLRGVRRAERRQSERGAGRRSGDMPERQSRLKERSYR
jgi:O-antigen/teichoic acid export membrane protein